MQIDAVENALFSATVNPLLRPLISRFDKECPRDGSLLLNSLKDFLGEPLSLCPTCQHISRKIARPFHEVGSRLLRADKNFMRSQFLKKQYGEAWFRGIGLMMKDMENVANFLGGCGAGRLYCCVEPNGDLKPGVFFPTNKNTVLGNVLKDSFGEIWGIHPLLWKLRIRESLEDYMMDGKRVGCGYCPDKYICGGGRARAYSYFNGSVNKPDIGCIHNKPLWEKLVRNKR